MKNLLNISDLNQNDFESILQFADDLSNHTEQTLTNKNIGLIFEKNSTRTRLSFQVGINQLDGKYIDVRFEELNLNSEFISLVSSLYILTDLEMQNLNQFFQHYP